jgi:hypothetical protein
MVDDFVLFTMVNNLCIDNKVQMHFNLKKTFKNFVLEQSRPAHAMQVVEENDDGKIRDSPLSIEEQYANIRIER